MVGAEKSLLNFWEEMRQYLSGQEMLTDDWTTTVCDQKGENLVCLLEAKYIRRVGSGMRKYRCICRERRYLRKSETLTRQKRVDRSKES